MYFLYFFLLLHFSLANPPFPLHVAFLDETFIWGSLPCPCQVAGRTGVRHQTQAMPIWISFPIILEKKSGKHDSSWWWCPKETVLGSCPSFPITSSVFAFLSPVTSNFPSNLFVYFATVILTFSVACDQKVLTDKDIVVPFLELHVVNVFFLWVK